MQLYAVTFISLLSSLYMFRAPTYDCTSGCRYICTPDDGRVCRPKHVEWIKQKNKIHCIQLHLLVISIDDRKCLLVFMWSNLHFCRFFTERPFSTYFREIHKYKVSRKSAHWEPRPVYRRTDGHDEANSHFRQILQKCLKMCSRCRTVPVPPVKTCFTLHSVHLIRSPLVNKVVVVSKGFNPHLMITWGRGGMEGCCW